MDTKFEEVIAHAAFNAAKFPDHRVAESFLLLVAGGLVDLNSALYRDLVVLHRRHTSASDPKAA